MWISSVVHAWMLFDSNFSQLCLLFEQGGPAPALVKAEVPWSAKRGNLSEKERVLKTVKG